MNAMRLIIVGILFIGSAINVRAQYVEIPLGVTFSTMASSPTNELNTTHILGTFIETSVFHPIGEKSAISGGFRFQNFGSKVYEDAYLRETRIAALSFPLSFRYAMPTGEKSSLFFDVGCYTSYLFQGSFREYTNYKGQRRRLINEKDLIMGSDPEKFDYRSWDAGATLGMGFQRGKYRISVHADFGMLNTSLAPENPTYHRSYRIGFARRLIIE